MDIGAVRIAMANAIRSNVTTSPALIVYPYTPDAVTTPCAYVQPQRIGFDTTFGRGHDEIEFTVWVLVSRADDKASQARMDTFLNGGGLTSIKRAVELSDDGLGGTCDSVRVTEADAYQWVSLQSGGGAEHTYLGVRFSVHVIGLGG